MMPTDLLEPELHEAAETEPAAESRTELTLLELLASLARRKRWIARNTLVVAVLALVVSLLLPRRYTAHASLLPPQMPQSLNSLLASQLGATGLLGAQAASTLGLKNPGDLFVAMLKSRTVEDALVRRFDLRAVYHEKYGETARRALEKRSDIEAGQTGLIIIAVRDSDRKRAAALANGYMEELRNLTGALAVTEAGQRRIFFEQQLARAKDNLADAEVALRQTEQRTGVIQLDSQARAAIEAVARLRGQIAADEVRLRTMMSFATAQNPEVVLVQQELSGLRAQLAQFEAHEKDSPGDVMVGSGKVPEAGLEYIRRLREVKYNEAVFEMLARQLEAARLDEARQGVVQVVDSAVEPERPSFPRHTLNVLLAALGALALSILAVIFQLSFTRARRDPECRRQLAELRQATFGERREARG